MKKGIICFIFLIIAKFSFCQQAEFSLNLDSSKLYIVTVINLKKRIITAKNNQEGRASAFKATSGFISAIKIGDSLYIYGNDIKTRGTTVTAKVGDKFTGKIISGMVVVQ